MISETVGRDPEVQYVGHTKSKKELGDKGVLLDSYVNWRVNRRLGSAVLRHNNVNHGLGPYIMRGL
jgi:hypothetical protein